MDVKVKEKTAQRPIWPETPFIAKYQRKGNSNYAVWLIRKLSDVGYSEGVLLQGVNTFSETGCFSRSLNLYNSVDGSWSLFDGEVILSND